MEFVLWCSYTNILEAEFAEFVGVYIVLLLNEKKHSLNFLSFKFHDSTHRVQKSSI